MSGRSLLLALAVAGMAILPGRAVPPPGPIPAGMAWYDSYPGVIAEFGRLLHRKAVASPELAEWMANHPFHGGGGFTWPIKPHMSSEELLEDFRLHTGLAAFPGKEDGTVRVDFAWHRPTDQASGDCLAFLLHQPPPKPGFETTAEGDRWVQQFDALLSDPGNFSRVWRLRATADDAPMFMGLAVNPDLLYVGPFLDGGGHAHTLFVINQEALINLGSGIASYYLFDAQGRFERGGVFRTGHRVQSVSAYANAERTALTLVGWFNDVQEVDQVYQLGIDGLALHSSCDDMGGILTNGNGLHLGEVVYVTP